MKDKTTDPILLANEIVSLVLTSLPLKDESNINNWIKSVHVAMLENINNKAAALAGINSSKEFTDAQYSLGENFDCLPPMIADLEVERQTIVEQINKYNDKRFVGIVRQGLRSKLSLASLISLIIGKSLYRYLFTAKKLRDEFNMSPDTYTNMVIGFDFRLAELNHEIKKLNQKLIVNTKKVENERFKQKEIEILRNVITSFTKKRVSLSNYLQ